MKHQQDFLIVLLPNWRKFKADIPTVPLCWSVWILQFRGWNWGGGCLVHSNLVVLFLHHLLSGKGS